MHVIPSLIPEAVLGTKEPSEKARTAAFDLVLAMGRKMSEGGVVRRGLIDGMAVEEDGEGQGVIKDEEIKDGSHFNKFIPRLDCSTDSSM